MDVLKQSILQIIESLCWNKINNYNLQAEIEGKQERKLLQNFYEKKIKWNIRIKLLLTWTKITMSKTKQWVKLRKFVLKQNK